MDPEGMLNLAWLHWGALGAVASLLALIHLALTGAHPSWVLLLLVFPRLGAVLYAVRAIQARGLGLPGTLDRGAAAKRLRQLEHRLAQWRGEALLADAAREAMGLRRYALAERYFREARQEGASLSSVGFDLARVLQVLGRHDEAIEVLRELLAEDPQHHYGEAALALGRSLDEAGRSEEALAALQEVSARWSFLEAWVRRARLLHRAGDVEGARRTLEEGRAQLEGMPDFQRKVNAPWIRLLRRNPGAATTLPGPFGSEPRRVRGDVQWMAPVAGAAGALGLVLPLATCLTPVLGVPGYLGQLEATTAAQQQLDEAHRALDALDRQHPWPHRGGLDAVVLTEDDVARYARVRAAVAPALRAVAEAHRALEEPDEGAIADYAAATRGAIEAQSLLCTTLAGALAEQQLGPTALRHLIELVEWRWLGREDALVVVVPERYRLAWLGDRRLAARPGGVERAQVEQARERLADRRAEAEAARALHEDTRARLESRRADLADGGEAGLAVLAAALDPSLRAWGTLGLME